MTEREALKLALEALEEAADAIDSWGSYASGYFQVKHDLEGDISKAKSAITAIKEALAQPEPWEKFCDSSCVWTDHHPDCKLAQPEYQSTADKSKLEKVPAKGTLLAQPEQEPVAFSCLRCVTPKKCAIHGCSPNTWPSETPPQRKPLTLDELWRVFTRTGLSQFHQRDSVVEYKYQKCIEEFARAIEAAHGIKENT